MSACYGWLQGVRRNGQPAQVRPKTARGFASVWAKLRNERGDEVRCQLSDQGLAEVWVNGAKLVSYRAER